MWRKLAALAAIIGCLAFARPVDSARPKLAVLFSSEATWKWGIAIEEWTYFWNQLGLPIDFYNVEVAGSWGDAQTTDDAWFSARYDAILIVNMRNHTIGAGFESNFDNTGWGPLRGDWGIPVYVYSIAGMTAEDEDASGGAAYRNGARISGGTGGGVRIVPSTNDSLGTHAYKVTSYLRNTIPNANTAGQIRDTLYSMTFPGFSYLAVESTAFPADEVQPIMVIDTVATALSVPAGWATGRLMVMWRYKPTGAAYGVVYSLGYVNENSYSTGALALLELMARETDLKPLQKLRVAATDHNYGSSDNAASFGRYLDSLEVWNIPLQAIPKCAPCDYDAADAASWALAQDFLERGKGTWAPYSGQSACGGVDWQWADTLAADTTQTRSLYNKMVGTCSHPDSMGLPMSAYNPTRLTPSGGIVGKYMLQVAYDAGAVVMDNGLAFPAGNAMNDYAYHRAAVYPHVLRGSGARVWVAQTQSLAHPATFTELTGGAAANKLWTWHHTVEWIPYVRGMSWFWHSDTSAGGSDPYWSYMMSVLGRWVAQFPTIMEWERRNPQVERPANY